MKNTIPAMTALVLTSMLANATSADPPPLPGAGAPAPGVSSAPGASSAPGVSSAPGASSAPKVSPAPAPDPELVERALRRLERQEPDLERVRARALEHAGLDGSRERAWPTRARLSGLLPDLTVRAGHATSQDRDTSRSSTGTERLDQGLDVDVDLEIRADWELGRLVFDDIEIRALQAEQRTYRERVQLLAQVTSLYYQRRKLVLAGMLAPQNDPYRAALHAMTLAELTGQLDALTGGYFSRALSERAEQARAP